MPENIDTYLAYIRSKGEGPKEENLRVYLNTVVREDINAEFKSASEDSDFQVRKAVASLGNRHGGEVFVGVREPDLCLCGTSLTEDDLLDRLRQNMVPGEWFSVDVSLLVKQTTAVSLEDATKRVIVAEVRKGHLPTLVIDEKGEASDVKGTHVWFRRHGRKDRKLTAYEGVEAQREYTRGRLLLELYREYETVTRSIPSTPFQGMPLSRAYFSLPRYDAARADGSFYSSLVPEDTQILLASKSGDPNQRWSPGILPRLISAGELLDRKVSEYNAAIGRGLSRGWDEDVANYVRSYASDFEGDRERFANHLRELGLLPKGPK